MIDWQKFKDRIDLNVFKRVYKDCLGVSKQRVLIVGDYGIRNRILSPILTNGYALAARELGLDYRVFIQNAKARGEYADEVLQTTLQKLPKGSVIVLNVSNRVGKLGSVGLSFRKFCYENNHQFITSSSLGSLSNKHLRDVIRTIDVDYKKMHREGRRIKKILDKGKEVNVTSKNGTDITMDIIGVKSIINSGIYTGDIPGGNIPAGEVYLYPNEGTVNGTYVVDGSMRLKNRTLLVRNPVKIEVEDGEITNISSNYEGKLFKQTLEWAHRKAKNPWGNKQIAELGIGINPNARVVGATVIDEKTRGTVHIANGSNSWFGGDIKSIIHLDNVIKDAIVKVDGKVLRL